MADGFLNPFESFNPSHFAGNPAMGGRIDPMQAYMALQKQNLAMPFVNQAQERQQQVLESERQKQAEFMSPEAQNARKQKMLWEAEDARGKIEMNPARIKAEIEEARVKAKYAGPEAEAKLGKMTAEWKNLNGSMYQKLLESASEVGHQISKDKSIPPDRKAFAYQQAIASVQQQFPDLPLPKQLQTWGPETELTASSLRAARLNSAANQHDRDLQTQRDTAANQRNRDDNATQAGIAANRLASEEKRHTEQYGSREEQLAARIQASADQAVARNPRYKSLVESLQFPTLLQSQGRSVAAVQKEASELEEKIRKPYEEQLRRLQTPNTSNDTVIVKDKQGKKFKLPKSQLNDAIKQGYSEVK